MFLLILINNSCSLWTRGFTFHYVSINTRSNTTNENVLSSTFTFHYVSINTWISATHEPHILALHSIMFLLILKDHAVTFSIITDFTFHYVSINTTNISPVFTHLNFFTFHYVSINTKMHKEISNMTDTLHSIMFLLILQFRLFWYLFVLSLHSIMFLLILLPAGSSTCPVPSFTFHYVSINTRLTNKRRRMADDFTFHYVSINTRCNIIMKSVFTTLHSIMFLLIPGLVCATLKNKKALHSIMFLLILAYRLTQYEQEINFTFHYVSINTY